MWIKGYEGLYSITKDGRVYSFHFEDKREMSQETNKDGHKRVKLNFGGKSKKFFVHRLVAIHYIPNPENLPIVNHLNENPSDNRVENLEWNTIKGNNNHGTRNKRMAKSKEKAVYEINEGGEIIAEYNSSKEIVETGVCRAGLSAVLNKRQKTTANGRIFIFKEDF